MRRRACRRSPLRGSTPRAPRRPRRRDDRPSADEPQDRINTTNFYLAVNNLESFLAGFSRIRLTRVVWGVVVGAIIFLIMLSNVFDFILVALRYQAVLTVSWTGCALVFVAAGRFLGEELEWATRTTAGVRSGRRGCVGGWDRRRSGLLAFGDAGSWTGTWALPIAFVGSAVVQGVGTAARKQGLAVLVRPHDPRTRSRIPWRCTSAVTSAVLVRSGRDGRGSLRCRRGHLRGARAVEPGVRPADAAGSAPRNASCSGHGQPRQPLLVGECQAHLPGRRCCRSEDHQRPHPPARAAGHRPSPPRNTGSCPSALAADHPTEAGAASQPRACAQTTGGPTPEPAGRDARGRITPAISRWRSVRVAHRPALRPGKESALPWSDSCRRCGDPAIASYRGRRLWLGRRWAADSVNTASTTLRGRDEQHQQRGSERSVRPAGAIPICRRRARTRCAEGRAHSYRLRPRRCRSGRRSGCFARAVDSAVVAAAERATREVAAATARPSVAA